MDYGKIILILLILFIVYKLSQNYSEGFETTSVPALLNNWNAINQLSLIAGQFTDGTLKLPSLEIANKWGLYDTGDNWIRLNNIGNKTTNMTGDTGIAMQKLSVNNEAYLNGATTVKGTLLVDGNATLGLVNGRNILAELNALASLQFDNNNSANMDTLVKNGTCKNYTQCVDRMCLGNDFGGCRSKIANARGPVCTKYYSVISYSPGDGSDSRYPGWK